MSSFSKLLYPHGALRQLSTMKTKNEIKRVFEVDRKFLPTPTSLALLRANKGAEPFMSFEPLGQSTIADIYYDYRHTLEAKGIWVRVRNGAWQAKMPTGEGRSDTTYSALAEVEGVEEVQELVRREVGVRLWDLGKIAGFEAVREVWAIDGFEVAVDTTDFGAVVGEVELLRVVEFGGKGDEKEWWNTAARELGERIEGFMGGYADVFPKGRAVGKLSAYFKKQERVRALGYMV